MTTTAIQPTSSRLVFDSTILRAYDIRGTVGDALTEEVAYALGTAFATMTRQESGVQNPRIATARDGRVSSPMLSEALIRGMLDAGAHVLDGGAGPTPMLYFATYHLQADAGIMVTGSHNPPHHNGFKMMLKGKPFFGEDIQKLGVMMQEGVDPVAGGSVALTPMFDAYIDRLAEGFHAEGAKALTVVWDAGNGAAGEAMAALTQKLPGTHHLLYEEMDGTFPNHHPDPTIPENLADLIAKVKDTRADMGVAFDGDGDRIGAVDSEGRILWGDQLLMFFAREILNRKPGATIIADVKASQTLFDDVAARGGKPLMWKTGHSLIKAKMAETQAAIAGEMSGHIFFADGYYGFDDGLYGAVRLMDLVAHSDLSLAQMRDSIPDAINTPEIRIDVDPARKFQIVEEIRDRLKQTDLDVNEVDGVRVSYQGGWWLARASNTQSALIVRCEAPSETILEALKDMVREQLEKSGIENVTLEPSAGH